MKIKRQSQKRFVIFQVLLGLAVFILMCVPYIGRVIQVAGIFIIADALWKYKKVRHQSTYLSTLNRISMWMLRKSVWGLDVKQWHKNEHGHWEKQRLWYISRWGEK